MVEKYEQYKDAIILFPDYYEIKGENKEYDNGNLKIKRVLLKSLKNNKKSHKKWRKRAVLSLGCAIGCPSVTFVKKNIKFPVFECDFKCDVDWNAWEKLSLLPGRFIYIRDYLMGHRIHEESTTTEIIKDNIRTKEDLVMFKRFWISPIANLINSFYVKSENNNKVK